MNANRINELSNAVCHFVFELLEGEPELDGNDAGYVAAQTEKQFKAILADMLANGIHSGIL